MNVMDYDSRPNTHETNTLLQYLFTLFTKEHYIAQHHFNINIDFNRLLIPLFHICDLVQFF